MKKRNRSDLLLVEILIAVLFFMLSLTILVQVFAGARTMTGQAGAKTRALAQAQNVADSLLGAANPQEVLQAQGFVSSHGVWTCSYDDYTLLSSGDWESAGTGRLWRGELKAFLNSADQIQSRSGEDVLFTLPVVWYEGGQ